MSVFRHACAEGVQRVCKAAHPGTIVDALAICGDMMSHTSYAHSVMLGAKVISNDLGTDNDVSKVNIRVVPRACAPVVSDRRSTSDANDEGADKVGKAVAHVGD